VEPSREAVAEVQGAAKEMIDAARRFLDAMERVVSDELKVTRALVGLTDVLTAATDLMARVSPPEEHGSGRQDDSAGSVGDDDANGVAPGSPSADAGARSSRVRQIVVSRTDEDVSVPTASASGDSSGSPRSGR